MATEERILSLITDLTGSVMQLREGMARVETRQEDMSKQLAAVCETAEKIATHETRLSLLEQSQRNRDAGEKERIKRTWAAGLTLLGLVMERAWNYFAKHP
jgi:hypothetical protein